MNNSGLITASALSTALALCATPGQAADSGEWEFSIAPLYLWAKSINGTSSVGGKDAPLDLDFQDDVLENLDAAFAFHFEARKDDLTLFLEYNFASLDPSGSKSRGPIEASVDIQFDDMMWEGGATWAFAESDTTRWEVLGGLRYYDQDLTIKIKTNIEGPGILPEKIRGGDSWIHPFGGMRVITKLSDRWSFRARADVGYEHSDNKALQGIAMFDYRFRDWGSAFVGYRYLDMEFDNTSSRKDQYGFDADQQGPLLGMNFYF